MHPGDTGLLQAARTAWRHGDAPAAMAMLERRLAAGNAPRELGLMLAKIAAAAGDRPRERRALEQVLSMPERPRDAPLLGRLATLHWAAGDTRAAARAFARATRLQPREFPAWQGLARSLLARQDTAEARRVSAHLLNHFPDEVFSHLLAGHLAKADGDAERAAVHYQRALAGDGQCGEALYALVDLDTPTPGSALGRRVLAPAPAGTSPADRINRAFAGARILDRAGHYAAAMTLFRCGNREALEDLARRGIVDTPERLERRTRTLQGLYPTPLSPGESAQSTAGVTPIFVIGLPRSGTTLVEQILAGHPQVAAGGELPFAQECERRFEARRRRDGRRGPVEAGAPQDARLLQAARADYLGALASLQLDRERWLVDKLPGNFQSLGFLRLLFPTAPILHLRRDLRATAFSLYCANFAAHEPYYHSLEGLVRYCRYYQSLMQHWQERVPGVIDVDYENLVSSPERAIPALLQATGIGTYPGCTAPRQPQQPVFTASHAQVRQPIHTRAIGHWRHYESWLGPVAALGA